MSDGPDGAALVPLLLCMVMPPSFIGVSSQPSAARRGRAASVNPVRPVGACLRQNVTGTTAASPFWIISGIFGEAFSQTNSMERFGL